MKITKRQLRRIIKEERRKLISEQSAASEQGRLLADLSMTMDAISDIASGMYGLVDPGDTGGVAGDDMANDLELQVARLNAFYTKLELLFQAGDNK